MSATEHRGFFEYRNLEGRLIYRKVIADVYTLAIYSWTFPGFFLKSGGLLGVVDDWLLRKQWVTLRGFEEGMSYIGALLPPFLYLILPAGRDKNVRLLVSVLIALPWLLLLGGFF